MMNVFNIINQYNKNMYSTYGDILDNNLSIGDKLSATERKLYNQYKLGDIQRFKMNENKNLVDNSNNNINNKVKDIPGIGMVTQIC